ncbi:MAG: YjbQ family protein [Leptolyngbyaceae cyanobacterium T60_A2020_046]|nr:YjbQ family protein [Leptolyngbyaceae cyanobacterium T60_A2020_046]
MHIHPTWFELATTEAIAVYNLTPQIQSWIDTLGIQAGQVTVCSQHTTTAIAINEDEERLLIDIVAYLKKLAPPGDRYLHNDLHLRDVPPDEPENAHAHLMAMTLGSSETIPIVAGKLALGTYQSILFVELDGPRSRRVLVQAMGQ